MAQSKLEKNVSQRNRDQNSGQLIVPLLHDLLRSSLKIETEDDAQFLYALAKKQIERDKVRQEGDGVFSPSGLASCLRRVYLSKNWKSLGLERVELPAIEPNYYFFTGDFIHLKWQFACYKLSAHPCFTLIDVEFPVLSKRKDHGGTIDILALLSPPLVPKPELVIIDAKGLKFSTWRSIDEGSPPHNYRIQIVDYGMLFNAGVKNGLIKPQGELKKLFPDGFPKVKRVIILAENKGGPDSRHPAALTEHVISIKDSLPDVRARLEHLRQHEEEETIPEIECEGTRGVAFQGCPFSGYCKKEVRAVERQRAKDRDTKEYRIARPKRSHRSRRPRS